MHEWALAESVIATIVKTADERGAKSISRAVVMLGEMQGIDRSIFDFALAEISKTRPQMAKAKIRIEMIPTKFRCKSCKNEWSYDKVKKKVGEEEAEDIHFIPEVVFAHTRCPKCNGVDFELIEGRGVYIDRIEFGAAKKKPAIKANPAKKPAAKKGN